MVKWLIVKYEVSLNAIDAVKNDFSVLVGDGCHSSLSGSEYCQEQRSPGSVSSNLQVVHNNLCLLLSNTDAVLLLGSQITCFGLVI